MPTVDLSAENWGKIMAILSTAPWRDANPLLMEIGQQLQAQAPPQQAPIADGNTKEVPS